GWAAATNLATNPSMESAGATITIRKNSAADPSFEARIGPFVDIRTNYAARPTFSGLEAGAAIPEYPSTALTEVKTSDYWSATAAAGDFLSMELTALTQDNDTYVDITPAGLTITPGKYYTISATRQISDPLLGDLSPFAAAIVVKYTDTMDGLTKYKYEKGDPGAVGERRITNIFRVPEGASNVRFLLYNGSGLVRGETNRDVLDWNSTPVRWDNLLITEGADEGSFFDASTAGGDLVSYTTVSGQPVERRMTSTRWTITAGNSLYLASEGAGTSQNTLLHARFVRDATVSSVGTTASGLTLDPTYPAVTVGAGFRANTIPVPLTPVLVSLDVEEVEGIDPMPYIFGSSRTITPVDGFVEIRSPIIKPEGDFSVGFLLQESANTELNMKPGSSGDPTDYQVRLVGSVDIDKVLVVDGTYRGSYFDGANPSPDMLTSWEGGTVNGTSIAQSPKVVGITDGPEALTYRSKMWSMGGTS